MSSYTSHQVRRKPKKKFTLSDLSFDFSLLTDPKYHGILFSIVLFVLLDASVMALSFYTSYQIADDAVAINLAGRQRMLTQRMTKSLYALNTELANSPEAKSAKEELVTSKNLFDETLTAFMSGGMVRNAGKEMVNIAPVSSADAQRMLSAALTIWTPYKKSVDALLNEMRDGADSSETLVKTLMLAKTHNVALLKLMNDFTVSLEKHAAAKASRLRTIQTVGIVLAVLNFLFILMHFLKQLRDGDAVLEKMRKETSDIFHTVNEGLFLVDKQLIIGGQYSTKLTEILGTDDIAGQSFQSLLETIVTEKDANTARGFIELLFDKKVKEKLIGSLNPLSLVKVNIGQQNGGYLTKYLQFNFARVYRDGAIVHVLVTAQDVTEKVQLEKALAETRKQNESQIEMLTGLLHTHPSLLQEFIMNSYDCFNRINNILRQTAKTPALLRDKIAAIFREVHNFKGESSALKLEYFESQAHLIEDTLAALRSKEEISGNDYLPLTVQLENLISYTQQIEELTEKLALFGSHLKSPNAPQPPSVHMMHQPQQIWSQLADFVQELAQRNGKLVKFVASGLNEIPLAPTYAKEVKDMCIQLIRNAVVHGVESPRERELSQKPLEGRIDLRMAQISEGEMEIMVMDDGAGLDYDAIRQKAVESGRWHEDEIDSWDNKNLLGLIFHEGFSTAKDVSKDAGRGVGMDAVMTHVLRHRGKISVSSRRGHHCRFIITLPIVAMAEEIAA